MILLGKRKAVVDIGQGSCKKLCLNEGKWILCKLIILGIKKSCFKIESSDSEDEFFLESKSEEEEFDSTGKS